MITYEFKIIDTICSSKPELFDNIIKGIKWELIGTQDDRSYNVGGIAWLPIDESGDYNFIAFEDITESQIETWCRDILGDLAVYEQKIATMIEDTSITSLTTVEIDYYATDIPDTEWTVAEVLDIQKEPYTETEDWSNAPIEYNGPVEQL